jgi:hypothetical protein
MADRPRPECCVRVRGMPHRWRVTATRQRSARRAARKTSTARRWQPPLLGWRAVRYMTHRCRRRGRQSAADLRRWAGGRRGSGGNDARSDGPAQWRLPKTLLSENACRQLTPQLSCKHSTTIATKSHPKSACLLQRLLGRRRRSLNSERIYRAPVNKTSMRSFAP